LRAALLKVSSFPDSQNEIIIDLKPSACSSNAGYGGSRPTITLLSPLVLPKLGPTGSLVVRSTLSLNQGQQPVAVIFDSGSTTTTVFGDLGGASPSSANAYRLEFVNLVFDRAQFAVRSGTLKFTSCLLNAAGRGIGPGITVTNPHAKVVLEDTTLTGYNREELEEQGGAMLITNGAAVEATGTLFQSNSANMGGGVSVRSGSSFTCTDCKFNANQALTQGSALYATGSSTVTLNGCDFEFSMIDPTANIGSAVSGGSGMHIEQSSTATVTACKFWLGQGGQQGGAARIISGSTVTFMRSIIAGNKAAIGGGLYISDSDVKLNSVTLYKNTATGDAEGPALFVRDDSGASKVVIYNSIIWADELKSIVWTNLTGRIGVYRSDWKGALTATSNLCPALNDLHAIGAGSVCRSNTIDEDPMLVDLQEYENKFIYLCPKNASSPVVNAGENINGDTLDVYGQPRPNGGGTDMGACEYRPNTAPNLSSQPTKTWRTTFNTVLQLPASLLLAQPGGLFSDSDGDAMTLDRGETIPTGADVGSLRLFQNVDGGLKFVPQYNAKGTASFSVVATDTAYAKSEELLVTVEVVGECCLWGGRGGVVKCLATDSRLMQTQHTPKQRSHPTH